MSKGNNSWIFSIILGVLVFGTGITLSLVFVPIKDTKFWISFVATIIALLSVFISSAVLSINDRHVSPRYSLVIVSVLYLILEIIVLVLLHLVFTSVTYQWYLVVQIALFVIYLIYLFSILGARSSIIKSSAETKEMCLAKNQLVSEIQSIISNLDALQQDIKFKLKKEFTALEEDVRFSDPISIEQTANLDKSIKNGITNLSAEIKNSVSSGVVDVGKIDGEIIALRKLIDERNRTIKLHK